MQTTWGLLEVNLAYWQAARVAALASVSLVTFIMSIARHWGEARSPDV